MRNKPRMLIVRSLSENIETIIKNKLREKQIKDTNNKIYKALTYLISF